MNGRTRGTRTARRVAAGLLGAAALALTASACGSSGTTTANPSPASAGSASGGIAVGKTGAGMVLVDAKGMTLYAFAADRKGHSACTGSCATYWPPVPGSEKAHVSSKVTAPVGTLTRSDGSTQLTVAGYPMYTYAGDSAAGQDNGQGKNLSGGLWWVVNPDGTWVKSTSGSSSGSSKGGGY